MLCTMVTMNKAAVHLTQRAFRFQRDLLSHPRCALLGDVQRTVCLYFASVAQRQPHDERTMAQAHKRR